MTPSSVLRLSFAFFALLSPSARSTPGSTLPSNVVTPNSSVACSSTSHIPTICNSAPSPIISPPSRYQHARHAVAESLAHAKASASMLAPFNRSGHYRDALGVCAEMAGDTVEYLETISSDLQTDEWALTSEAVGRVMTLMSAVITNQETCMDELRDDGFGSDRRKIPPLLATSIMSRQRYLHLCEHVANGSSVHAVALELVATALEGKPRSSDGFGYAKWVSEFSDDGTIIANITSGVPANRKAVVSQDGTGNFTTIAAAVEFAANRTKHADAKFVIFVREGKYRENVEIPRKRKNLILIGDGINRTVVTGNLSVDADGIKTYYTPTFATNGEGFVAMFMTFVNTAGPEMHQAVAVRNSANHSIFYRCSFMGYQDTLYAHRLNQFYRDCDIYGTVDFIFGNAAAVFQNCNIYPRKPLAEQKNTITAQGRKTLDEATGISIQNCTIRAAPDLEAELNATETFLGRPWKNYSTTVVMQSFIGEVVDPAGWLAWNGTPPGTIYYGEYGNYGPGSNTSGRVDWEGYRSVMNVTEALNFTVLNFTDAAHWLVRTPIPFFPGLI